MSLICCMHVFEHTILQARAHKIWFEQRLIKLGVTYFQTEWSHRGWGSTCWCLGTLWWTCQWQTYELEVEVDPPLHAASCRGIAWTDQKWIHSLIRGVHSWECMMNCSPQHSIRHYKYFCFMQTHAQKSSLVVDERTWHSMNLTGNHVRHGNALMCIHESVWWISHHTFNMALNMLYASCRQMYKIFTRY